MLGRLVERFWRWQLRRHDPDAEVQCQACGRTVRRADLYALGCCTKACAQDWQDTTAY